MARAALVRHQTATQRVLQVAIAFSGTFRPLAAVVAGQVAAVMEPMVVAAAAHHQPSMVVAPEGTSLFSPLEMPVAMLRSSLVRGRL